MALVEQLNLDLYNDWNFHDCRIPCQSWYQQHIVYAEDNAAELLYFFYLHFSLWTSKFEQSFMKIM